MTPTLPDVPAVETQIVALTNAFRKDNRLGEVKPNPMLRAAAQAFAEYLAKSGAFSHTADGREPAGRAEAAGYSYCLVAENLAYFMDSRGFDTGQLARQTVDGWINSPGHRQNLLTADVTEIGVAVTKAPDVNPKYIAVQMFGRPLSMQFSFSVINTTTAPLSYTFAGERTEVQPRMSITQTTCSTGTLQFETSGAGLAARAINAKFEPRRGQVFKVVPGSGGGVKVEVTTKSAAP